MKKGSSQQLVQEIPAGGGRREATCQRVHRKSRGETSLFIVLRQHKYLHFLSGRQIQRGRPEQEFRIGISCGQEDKSSLQPWDRVSAPAL